MKCDKSGREASLNKKRVVTPNDLKLSDCPARRDGCAGEGGGAAGVTRGAVRSSAWLGVAAVGNRLMDEVLVSHAPGDDGDTRCRYDDRQWQPRRRRR